MDCIFEPKILNYIIDDSKPRDRRGAISQREKQSKKCPAGYQFKEGDFPGDGIKRYSASLKKCTNDCTTDAKCKAFEYSERSRSNCKLLSVDNPINIQFEDFIFCKKEGI